MNEETIVDFGLKVRQFRTAFNLKIDALAALSGLKVSEIIAIEQGTFPLTHPVVAALVQALRDAPSTLFQTASAKGSLSAGGGTEAGDFFNAAPPEVQEATLWLLREIGKGSVSPPANSPSN